MDTLIDSHTHLETFHRAGHLGEILHRAEQAGIGRMITVGTSPGDWKLYQTLARENPKQIAYSVGIHPCHVTESWEEEAAVLPNYFASQPLPVALGEIGLDRFHLSQDPETAAREMGLQKQAFEKQIELADKHNVPVIIHSRGAFDECVEMIDASNVSWEKVVFHCFTEGLSSMQKLLDRGGRASFTGVLTYKKAEEVRESLLLQGLEKLMVETDAPYLAPVPHRGKGNEPAYLKHTAAFAAQLLDISLDELTKATNRNTSEFFGLPQE